MRERAERDLANEAPLSEIDADNHARVVLVRALLAEAESHSDVAHLDEAEWKRALTRLPSKVSKESVSSLDAVRDVLHPGVTTSMMERKRAFVVERVISATDARIELERVRWFKKPFTVWWDELIDRRLGGGEQHEPSDAGAPQN